MLEGPVYFNKINGIAKVKLIMYILADYGGVRPQWPRLKQKASAANRQAALVQNNLI